MTDIRANDLRVGDVFREYGDEEELTVAIRDDHGDTVLLTAGEGYQRSFDIDEVVLLLNRPGSSEPEAPPTDPSAIHEYAFDATLRSVVRVAAWNEDAARRLAHTILDGANLGFVRHTVRITEASLDGDLSLFELDGVPRA